MTRQWSLLLCAGAMASGCAKPSADGAAIPREVPDSTRGRLLAAAAKSGAARAHPEFGTGRMQVSSDAIIAGKSGSAIVAVVVRPDGRAERATRTVLFMDGNSSFAKSICDFALTAKFAPRPPDARGAIAFMPVSFDNGGSMPRGSGPARPDTSTALVRRMRAAQPNIDRQLAEMNEAEAKEWFRGHPPCTKIK